MKNDNIETENAYVSIAELRYQTPERQRVRLMPWFISILALIAIAGFWLQYDAWMDNRWFRSTLINLGLQLQQRDKDWRILPNSVQPSWITRSDGSKALIIKGLIKNLLNSDMYAPKIKITFFSSTSLDQEIGSQLLDFTYPPSQQVMLQTPYQRPNLDNTPITALEKHRFIFLIDKLPQSIGDFSLTVHTITTPN